MQVSCTPRKAIEAHLAHLRLNAFRRRKWLRNNFKRKVAGGVWLDATQEFQLFRGDAPFGRTKVMTGREARDANREFEDQFAKRCVENPERRLWRWRPVDATEVQKLCRKVVNERVP